MTFPFLSIGTMNFINIARFSQFLQLILNSFWPSFLYSFPTKFIQFFAPQMELFISIPFLLFLATIYSMNVDFSYEFTDLMVRKTNMKRKVVGAEINVGRNVAGTETNVERSVEVKEFQKKKRKFFEEKNVERNLKRKLEDNSLTILENVCGEKKESESPRAYHARRTKRNPIADLIVSNLVSVITGSFMNDFVLSNFWDKLTFCFRTVFSREHFFRGWKRCWEYWRLGEQKWRKALKPHIVANIYRKATLKLKEADEGGRRFQGAMIQIQEEFNKIFMDGSQTVRMLNILQEAGLQLPDLHWKPIQEEMDSVEMANKILEKDWRSTSFEFYSIFDIYNTILNILEREFEKLFNRIEQQNMTQGDKKVFELFEEGAEINEAQKIVNFRFSKDNSLVLKLNWKYLLEKYKIGKDQYTGKYLSKLLEWMGIELLNQFTTEANQLFFHAFLANFVARILSNNISKELENAIRLNKLSRCLLRLVNEKEEMVDEMDPKKKKMVNKFGNFELFDRKYLDFNELNGAVSNRIKQIKIEKVDPIGLKNSYEKLALNVVKKYQEFLNMKREDNDDCEYASGVLELDIGQINMKMGVEWDVEKLEIGSSDEDKKMLEIIEDIIQNLFFHNEKGVKQLKSKEHISNRHAKAKELSEKDMRDLEELLVLVNFAILGQIMATDLVREKVQLGRIVQMMGSNGGKVLILDEGRPNKFKVLAEKMLEWIHNRVMKFKIGDQNKVVNHWNWKEMLNGTFHMKLKKSKHEDLNKFVDEEFEFYQKKMENWLETMLLDVKNVDRIMGGPTPIGIPMRLSMDKGRRAALAELGEKSLVQRTLKRMEYAKKVKKLDVVKFKEDIVKGVEKANANIEDVHPRKKRLVNAIFWGLITGWLGNLISQYVDISKTLRNCIYRHDCKIVKTDDVLRRQREKGMLNFLEKAYKILIAKLIELDPIDQKPLKELDDDIGDYLLKVVHAEGFDEHFNRNLKIGNILLELEILNFSDFRHHIEQIIANDTEEGKNTQEEVILLALREFASNGWLHEDWHKNYELCAKTHKRIVERINRKECQQKMWKAQMDDDGDKFAEIWDKKWMQEFAGGNCNSLIIVKEKSENENNIS